MVVFILLAILAETASSVDRRHGFGVGDGEGSGVASGDGDAPGDGDASGFGRARRLRL
jgi:hypothetical protein